MPQTANRIVERENARPLRRIGIQPHPLGDLYHHALTASWPLFIAIASGAYLALNVVFAGLYLIDMAGIDNARPGSFADAFFFSIQTMATIGYGRLVPLSIYANLVVTIETLFSLFTVALVTGLLFARFSRPTARVRFGRVAVIGPLNGIPTLSVRAANERRNQILAADVGIVLLRMERTAEGRTFRRFYDLTLARSRTPVFSFSFQIMHPIMPDSPLHGLDRAALMDMQAELLVTVSGHDETSAQIVHARYSYRFDEVQFGHRFEDLFGELPDGQLAIDYRRFDETVPI